jgi:hypothetical protein
MGNVDIGFFCKGYNNIEHNNGKNVNKKLTYLCTHHLHFDGHNFG